MRALRANLLLLLFSLAFCLVGAELALRLLRLGFNNTPLNPSATRHHQHPTNYTFQAYSLQDEWGGFEIQTDRFGNRSLKGLCEFPAAGPKRHVLMLGDSFVEGFQVSDADSMAGQLQQQLCGAGVAVHNLGVSSYSPVLSEIQLREYQQQHPQGPVLLAGGVVVHVLYDNDLDGDQGYSSQLQPDSNGEMVVSSETQLSPLERLARVSYLARLLRRAQLTVTELGRRQEITTAQSPVASSAGDQCPRSAAELEPTRRALRAIRDRVAAAGGRYLISAVPSDPRKAPHLEPCFAQLAQELEVPYVPMAPELLRQPEAFYFTHDMHLNPQGNRYAAGQLLLALPEEVKS
ncbi:MAG TPA: hypothetical protein DGR08_06085 [Synechococcales bacterium UBA12195]|jgi:hypothetical protein|nr:MAG: hypothetical protein DBW81_01760 [Synechococcus sp. MED-G67]HCA61247.1 hypothetical protein [Synechococcales bacterium UBA8647]HCV57138.1 hypothetical protein [Synechococcales bacterium UBA12195]|tara:strand:+ start:394 stop:1437 length:1044 start_codon:yes stop_codon:yes gene_type:complete